MPDLSIIVVSFNTKQITKNCIDSILRSLKNSNLSFEIIVLDNDSKDDSIQMLKRFESEFDNIELIQNTNNVGFGRANNQGIKQAKGNYILLLNSDTVVLNDAISKLLLFYKESEEKIHFLGGKLLNKNRTPQPSAAHFFSLPVIFGALFLRGDYWGLTRSSPTHTKKVDWVSGACILAKKEYFKKLEGFDEDIFIYMEEVDLLYRAKEQGYETYFYPGAQFIHLGSASSGGKTFPILQVYKGFLFFYKKHRSRSALFWLKFMLKLKAGLAVLIGKITKNNYLIQTYEKAYQLVKMGR